MSRKRSSNDQGASDSEQDQRQGGGGSPADATRSTEGKGEAHSISDLGPDSTSEPMRSGEVY